MTQTEIASNMADDEHDVDKLVWFSEFLDYNKEENQLRDW